MLMAKTKKPFFISKKINPDLKILGEATGFFKIQRNHAGLLKKILGEFVRQGKTNAEYEETYNRLMQRVTVGVETVGNHFWTEMDFEKDRKKILTHLQEKN